MRKNQSTKNEEKEMKIKTRKNETKQKKSVAFVIFAHFFYW